MKKDNTPQQEFYTMIKWLNSGIRQKVWLPDESYNTNSDSKVVSINACIPRNNKRKTNNKREKPSGNHLFKLRELKFYQVEFYCSRCYYNFTKHGRAWYIVTAILEMDVQVGSPF